MNQETVDTPLKDQFRGLRIPDPALDLMQIRSSLRRLIYYEGKLGVKSKLGPEDRALIRQVEQDVEALAPSLAKVYRLLELEKQERNRELQEMSPHREPVPISRDSMLIVLKNTMVEIDMQRNIETEQQTYDRYRAEGIDADKVFASHRAQVEFIKKLRTIFKPEQFLSYGDVNPERISKTSLLVMVGGDNHFQYGAHFITGDTPILGVNSDPTRSVGFLLGCSANDFELRLSQLERAEYRLEPWSRLGLKVNGSRIRFACCDLFIGESNSTEMSRDILHLDGIKSSKRSSGLLIAVGPGTTGWAAAAGRAESPRGDFLPNGVRIAKYVYCLPSVIVQRDSETGLLSLPFAENSEGYISGNDRLLIESVNDNSGIASADSQIDIPFPRGAKAEVFIDENPNWVVGFKT